MRRITSLFLFLCKYIFLCQEVQVYVHKHADDQVRAHFCHFAYVKDGKGALPDSSVFGGVGSHFTSLS